MRATPAPCTLDDGNEPIDSWGSWVMWWDYPTNSKMGTIDAIEHDPAGLTCNQTQSMDQNNQLFVKEPLFILLCHQTWPGKSSVNGGFFWLGKSSINEGFSSTPCLIIGGHEIFQGKPRISQNMSFDMLW